MAGGSRLSALRTAVWHFRKGGWAQVRQWRRRQDATPTSFRLNHRRRSKFRATGIPEWQLPEPTLDKDAPRVGTIMDEFSASAWSYEFNVTELKPILWKSQVEDIDVFFAESAWAGSQGAWQYQLTGSRAPSDELKALVEECRKRSIPTVFWNKEDPPHFNDFLETAKLFDHVFTTDADMLPKYREALGHDRVEVLGFAAQPAIHNPIRVPNLHQVRDVAFGGTYFSHKYPERQAQMDLLLGAATNVSKTRGLTFDIFSRHQGDPKYQFPEPLDSHVRGSLNYRQMLTAYRMYKAMLNVNSVPDSPTMLARRVFEIIASGTPVISTRSPAIEHWFGHDGVTIVDEADDAESVIRALVGSRELRDRTVHLAQRRIWQQHTFAHRADQVLAAARYPHVKRKRPTVTALASTIRPELVDNIITQAARQKGVPLQLALLTHGFSVDAARLRDQAEESGIDLILLEADRDTQLGDNLNRLVKAAEGEVLLKFDDDDHYGPEYTSDSLYALDYSGADIVGKQARYVYLAATGATIITAEEREHRFTDHVAGATMIGRRDVFADIPFESRTTGEDTAFQRTLLEQGGTIYAADRFNFAQFRGSSNHTFQVTDARMIAGGRVIAFADLMEHINV